MFFVYTSNKETQIPIPIPSGKNKRTHVVCPRKLPSTHGNGSKPIKTVQKNNHNPPKTTENNFKHHHKPPKPLKHIITNFGFDPPPHPLHPVARWICLKNSCRSRSQRTSQGERRRGVASGLWREYLMFKKNVQYQ